MKDFLNLLFFKYDFSEFDSISKPILVKNTLFLNFKNVLMESFLIF